jgi:hypothetical protein
MYFCKYTSLSWVKFINNQCISSSVPVQALDGPSVVAGSPCQTRAFMLEENNRVMDQQFGVQGRETLAHVSKSTVRITIDKKLTKLDHRQER